MQKNVLFTIIHAIYTLMYIFTLAEISIAFGVSTNVKT